MTTELDNLKTGWTLLNKQLEENEVLNRRIIRKMIRNRTQTAYSRLLAWDLIGMAFSIAVLIALFVVPGFGFLSNVTITSLSIFIAIIVSVLVWLIGKIVFLYRLDPSTDSLIHMQQWFIRFQKIRRGEMLFTKPVGIAAVIAIVCIEHYYNHLSFLLVRLGIIGIAILFTWMLGKYVYLRTIKQMEDSLAELSEFESEERLYRKQEQSEIG